MSLIQFREVQPFSDEFFAAPFFPLTNERFEYFPALDVKGNKENYTIKVDLPGVKKEDVQVSFENGLLTIQGERKNEAEQKEEDYYRFERSYGRFTRSLNLGSNIDADKIQANYKDGVLEIIVAKTAKAQPKAIDIKVG